MVETKMRRGSVFVAILLGLALVLAPALAMARAGSGSSFGSRGTRTYSAPPPTATAPAPAQPFQRSLTPPPSTPGYTQPSPGFGQPAYAGRSGGFMSGLMGGLIGAGIGGLLFGGGLFHGISGIGGFIGLLFQIFLIVMIGRWLLRLLFRQPAMAGAASTFARSTPMPSGGPMPIGAGGPAQQPLQISPADFQAFEQLLKAVQAAWSAQDLTRLRMIASPEMVSYFSEQLSEHASRGLRNTVTDVKLEQGDLSEAWSEGGRDYATVAMRFSMVDATRDSSGRIVEGDEMLRTMATELWTFVRAPGGHWLLSAIQQTH